MGLARGGARSSGSRYRARCAVVLRRLRLRLPGLRLWLWHRLQLPVLRLWLGHRLQLPGLRLWLWHRLQLPVLRLWLWHRLQLPGLRLWLWQGHCPPWSLCRRLASLALNRRTKSIAPDFADAASSARRALRRRFERPRSFRRERNVRFVPKADIHNT